MISKECEGKRFQLLPDLVKFEPRFFIVDGGLGRCPCCYSMYSSPTWSGLGRRCQNCQLEAELDSFNPDSPAYSRFFDNFRSDNVAGNPGSDGRARAVLTAMAAECLLSAHDFYTSYDINSFSRRLMRRVIPRVKATAKSWDSGHPGDATVSLGIISRRSHFAQVAEIMQALKTAIAETVVVVDTSDTQEAEKFADQVREILSAGKDDFELRTIGRALAANFSAQRNAVMDNIKTDWVLWMDTDERPDASLTVRLPFLIQLLRRQKKMAARLQSIVRTNGRESLFSGYSEPRLVRRDVRFIKPVHEQIEVPWHRIFTDLGSQYIHYQTVDDQLQKKIIYENITSGAGKPLDLIMKCLSTDGHIIAWIPEMAGLVEPLH